MIVEKIKLNLRLVFITACCYNTIKLGVCGLNQVQANLIYIHRTVSVSPNVRCAVNALVISYASHDKSRIFS